MAYFMDPFFGNQETVIVEQQNGFFGPTTTEVIEINNGNPGFGMMGMGMGMGMNNVEVISTRPSYYGQGNVTVIEEQRGPFGYNTNVNVVNNNPRPYYNSGYGYVQPTMQPRNETVIIEERRGGFFGGRREEEIVVMQNGGQTVIVEERHRHHRGFF